jgi:hypothetical protein
MRNHATWFSVDQLVRDELVSRENAITQSVTQAHRTLLENVVGYMELLRAQESLQGRNDHAAGMSKLIGCVQRVCAGTWEGTR